MEEATDSPQESTDNKENSATESLNNTINETVKAASKKASRLSKDNTTGTLDPVKGVTEYGTLSEMFGSGSENKTYFKFNGKDYQVHPFRLTYLTGGSKRLSDVHDVLLAASMTEAASDGTILDYESVKDMLTSFYNHAGNDIVLDHDQIKMMILGMYGAMGEPEAVTNIVELGMVTLNRKSEVITREELNEELDVPSAIQLLRGIFNTNIGLKARFLTPLETEK